MKVSDGTSKKLLYEVGANWISGYESFREYKQFDILRGCLLNELNSLFDRGIFVHIHGRCVGCSHFEFGFFW